MSSYQRIKSKIEAGKLVVLDGGTGTDLQRRGVPMCGEVWCALANLSHGNDVRAVHSDYIDAGADIITANTYASSPVSFSELGRTAEIEPIDRAAVRLAREAAEGSKTAIAGSISVMPAIAEGTDRVGDVPCDPAVLKPLYRRKAEILADAGCDLLIMEMMQDLEVSLWATEAAVATGLPVWVGMSAEADDDGALLSHSNHRWTLAELVTGLMATGGDLALIMHNDVDITSAALETIAGNWDGPFGAYPEAGHFEMPNWVFKDISPDDFAAACRDWHAAGACVLGGCCGTTPAHIAALADALASRR